MVPWVGTQTHTRGGGPGILWDTVANVVEHSLTELELPKFMESGLRSVVGESWEA